MQNEKDIQLLQLTYAAVLADATAQFAKENVLQNNTTQESRTDGYRNDESRAIWDNFA